MSVDTIQPLNDKHLSPILKRLHKESLDQEFWTKYYFSYRRTTRALGWNLFPEWEKSYLENKMVALDEDKCQFMYLLARQSNAQNIVEVGTSFGVSTVYLAAALRDNGSKGIVYGTEYEQLKATKAKEMWATTGLSDRIKLLEGDLQETLTTVDRNIDMVLIDIWNHMALPALLRVKDRLNKGAIILCDNVIVSRAGYEDLFKFLLDPQNGFKTMTLPFAGGLEYSVYLGST